MSDSFTIRTVPAAEIYPLRHAELRQGLPIETCIFPGDTDPDTLHFGVFDQQNLIGIATLFPEQHPDIDSTHAWRLRGMATAESHRGMGCGRQLVDHLCQYVLDSGGDVLWCNARVGALEFYEKLLFEMMGAPFDIPTAGLHYMMKRTLS